MRYNPGPMTPRSRARAFVPLLAAFVYVGYLVWQAPHTVHHFFEHDVEKSSECALNAAAERAPGTTVEAIALTAVTAVGPTVAVVVPDLAPRASRTVLGPRAPPHPVA